jgi:parvulin-like peptidyl-prolyl isomerase
MRSGGRDGRPTGKAGFVGMKSFGKYSKSIFLMIIFLIFDFAPLWAADANVGLKPWARVNGVAITQMEVDEATAVLLPRASYHGNVAPEKVKELQKQALDNLIKEELFYREGLKKGYKVPKSDIGKRVDEIVKKYPSKSAFKEALKKYGLTEEDVRKKVNHIMLADLFLKEEVHKKAQIKENQLLEYYEKNKEKFQKPEAARLSHILIKVPPEASKEEKEKLKKKAEDVYEKLKKGEEFAKLAWDNSDDPSRVKGGDLGVVHRGRLEPDMEGPAFALATGEMSGIVPSLYGYHIFKAMEKFPPQQLKFEEVKEKLKKELEEKEVEKRLTNLVKNLKENAKIEILVD